jgi:hypothetical protein
MKLKHASLVVAAMAVAATPVLSASAVDTETTTINSTVGSTIVMTTSASVDISVTPAGSSVQSIKSDTVTVNTNNAGGYNLKLKDSDATLNLVNGTNTITPTTGTWAAPVALVDGQWGYAVAGATGHDATYTASAGTTGAAPTAAKFAGILATDTTLKTTAVVANNDVTTVWYSARVSTTQPTGLYTDQVTYTATAN